MKLRKQTLRSIVLFLGAFILPFLIASVAAAQDRKYVVEKSVDFIAGGTITMEIINGNISVTAWDQLRVHVVAEFDAGDDEDSIVIEGMQLNLNRRGDRLEIELDYNEPDSEEFSIFDLSRILRLVIGGGNGHDGISYDIQVPRRTNVEMGSVSGNIRVEDVHGNHELSTVNGRLDVIGTQGYLEAGAVNGTIHIEEHRGSIEVETVNGAMHVEVRNAGENDNIALSTVNGSMQLFLSKSVRADIRFESFNGRLDSELPIETRGRRERNALEGTINGGGVDIQLESINGNVTIRPLE